MTQVINNVKSKLTELGSRVKEIEEAMDSQGAAADRSRTIGTHVE